MARVALITGITGQDGALLAEFLLSKGYIVHGIKRRTSLFNTARIDHLYKDPHEQNVRFFLHYGDLTDTTNLMHIIYNIQPDEIYNLGAQSHVQVSFETPEYTANSDALGPLRILEAIRLLGLTKKVRFYQATTSEIFGNTPYYPQDESTPFCPASPYGTAKLYGYWITKNYRDAYGIFASNGILFNHESSIRGETFVTRKITRAVARIKFGLQKVLYLGNLYARRDWGHARDYVRGMWMILNHDKPDDFVLATGTSLSVKEFCEESFRCAGIDIEWRGEGINEVGINTETGEVVVRVDPRYFRPNEVDFLIGNPEKAYRELGWFPTYTVKDLIKEMVEMDIYQVKREIFLMEHGYNLPEAAESYH